MNHTVKMMEKIINTNNFVQGQKKRSPYWDNIKGVLIILVVFAHCLYALQNKHINNIIVDSIYFFHMPAFVFVSGYFSKSERSRSKGAILQLLIAYVIIMLPFLIQKVCQGHEPRLLASYNSAWYLMALVIWRILTPYIANFKHIMPAMIVFTVLVGFWVSINGEGTLSINKVVTFWPYFLAGYLIKPETIEEKIRSKKTPYKLSMGLAAIVLGFLLEAVSYKGLHITNQDLLPNKYAGYNLEDPLARIAIMIVSALFIAGFLFLSVDKKIPILTTAGRNSLTIYLFHRMPTIFFSDYVEDMRSRVQISLAVVFTLAIIIVFGNNFIAKYTNLVIKNCADSISFMQTGNEKKRKIWRIITVTVLTAVFVFPIIMGFIK